MSAEEALHFGLIPRMHRGIFAMNELPELDELVQVGLFNILEERDVQIRGYPIRFDIDVLILFSANPATYNRSGKVIPQLKDRIGSVIHTHYPLRRGRWASRSWSRRRASTWTASSPWSCRTSCGRSSSRSASPPGRVEVHRPAVGRQRPVQHRQLSHDGRQRPAARRPCSARSPAVPRISDLGHLYSSSLGKLELDLMSSHQMTERQVLDAILAEAIRDVFDEYVDQHGLDEIAEIFGKGVKIEVGDMLPSSHYAERLKRVPPAWEKAFEVNAAENEAVRASCVEFVLAGSTPPTGSRARSSTGGSCMKSNKKTRQSLGKPGNSRRHHPHVPEVRSAELPQPDGSRRRTWSPGVSSTCCRSAACAN